MTAAFDLRMTASVSPDCGLEGDFLRGAATVLEEAGIPASYEFPGWLTFEALGRKWATGMVGLHVNDTEGYGDSFPGDERLLALELQGTVTLERYTDVLLDVIHRAAGVG